MKALAKKAAEFQSPALALTDNGNMFGAIEFYFACMDAGIKPILGLDAYLCYGSRLEKTQEHAFTPKVTLLARDLEGYRQLCKLSSIGYQEGFYYKPRIDLEVLAQSSSNLIALSGWTHGYLWETYFRQGKDKARERALELKKIFGERFYLEMGQFQILDEKEYQTFLRELSDSEKIPLVAANDVHFLTPDDQIAQEVLICIGTNRTLSDNTRFKLGSNQFYLKQPQKMREAFQADQELCDRTLEIAEQCNLKFKLKDEHGKSIYHLPSFPLKQGSSTKEEIQALSEKGLEQRFQEAAERGEPVANEEKAKYLERLHFELGVIDRMGFNGYFLIVQDFINWAKEQEIPVGPGRGSGAGSLVAFSLKITDLDPVPYKLLFERFLNPERVSMPDFDIDFCQDRRGEVIQYVTNKYGRESVSQIITYGKLQARAAIKDVGRVLGMTFPEVDVVTKLIPDKLGINLAEALEMEPRLREAMELNPQVSTLLTLAQKVEGMVRHAGIHAAGVIIADGELIRHAPLYKGADGENVVQYDMKHAEKMGLIKFDFLGLKTLTLIKQAFSMILKGHGRKISAHDISLNDPGIYDIMGKADTAGIFQFEGDGITDAIRKIRPSGFTDITAINALYRPGPMAMIPEYAKRKHGESPVEYVLEITRDVLQETYGIIVYQEQVMGIASVVAGYSLGEADMLRRAMGKKIKEEMDKHRERFLKGAAANGHDPKKSEELFDLMYKFADYGFNKSHAAAYCVVAAQTAWLKNYYPAEFFAALLSTEISDTDKVVKYIKDAQKHGITVRPPHVNHSEFLFTVHKGEIYFGLGAIKGLGQSAVDAILEGRKQKEGQQFTGLEDFLQTVDARKINKKTMECLIKAGALDDFEHHRGQLLHNYPRFLEWASQLAREKELGQISLFDVTEGVSQSVGFDVVKPLPRQQYLNFEKEVLGFYLSDHPLKGFESLSRIFATHTISQVPDLEVPEYNFRTKEKRKITVLGICTEMRELITKKGTRMAFLRFEDLSGNIEVICFPDAFAKFEALLKADQSLLLTAALEKNQDQVKLILDSVVTVEEALSKPKKLVVRLDKLSESEFAPLDEILSSFPGSVKVDLIMCLADYSRDIQFESERQVQLNTEFIETVQQNFGRTDFFEVKGMNV